MRKLAHRSLLARLFLLSNLALALMLSRGEAAPNNAADSVHIRVVPVGVTENQLEAAEQTALKSRALAALLQGTNNRHLYTEPLEGSGRFRAVFYDYTHQRVVTAEGSLGNPELAVASVQKNWQPEPSEEEFQEAVAILGSDPSFGPALQSNEATVYRPMPPVQGPEADRIVNVGFLPQSGAEGLVNEIVGVDLARKIVVRYPGRAPRTATAVNEATCGVRAANQSTTRRGTAGEYQLTVTDTGGAVLWDMLVMRPSISSGTNASGIELRNVTYKGHSVFKRAHVPILNVKYLGDECGPYRDWQYQEGMFQADGTDIPDAPGFRDCGTTPATTLLENGTDTGNFRGVAVYREGTEVVLVTELEAGWYRYIHEWRFDLNGTIHPRFGFGATANSCTCFAHTHHAYFRFDFDVDGPLNTIEELPLEATAARNRRVAMEKKVFRGETPTRFYRISGGKRSYSLYPGPNDGTADAYGQGDLWFLHWHEGITPLQAEIDDGHHFFDSTEADLDQFLTDEPLSKTDSVIWYHASFLHTPDDEADGYRTPAGTRRVDILSGSEVVGPDLVPEGY